MTNLNNIKNNNSKLDEIKYFAMLGYSVESVDFNDDKINLIRHIESTNHPISLVNYKNKRLHMVSLSTEKPMNQITAMSNSVPAESVVNDACYDDYNKLLGEEEYKNCIDMKNALGKLNAKDFNEKSKILFTHFNSVGVGFSQKLKQHLEAVRNVLVNAELCDESFLAKELENINSTSTKQVIKTQELNRN